jgi:hypothetical protein
MSFSLSTSADARPVVPAVHDGQEEQNGGGGGPQQECVEAGHFLRLFSLCFFFVVVVEEEEVGRVRLLVQVNEEDEYVPFRGKAGQRLNMKGLGKA